MECAADGAHRFFDRFGRRIPEAPALPAVRGDGESVIVGELEEAGVEVDPKASLPSWDGGSWDLQMALDALMPIGR